MKKDWIELWYKMAKGVKSEIQAIMATDVMEFWTIYDLWLDNIKEANARARQNTNNK